MSPSLSEREPKLLGQTVVAIGGSAGIARGRRLGVENLTTFEGAERPLLGFACRTEAVPRAGSRAGRGRLSAGQPASSVTATIYQEPP